MELFILRHGIAEPLEAASSMKDSERSLTLEGERKMRRIAKGMKPLGLSFDVIWTSPFRRARQTAEIVARVLQLKNRLEVFPVLAAGEKTKRVIEALRQQQNTFERILIVGHEPDLSGLISRLVSGEDNMALALKKGGLCKLTIGSLRYGRCAVLEWLLAPNQLVRIR